MRRLKTLILTLFALVLLAPAATARTTIEGIRKAAVSADSGTYFAVRRDYRKCMYPMCGGYWLKALNSRKTRCADGSAAEECYVIELDWSASGLSQSQIDGALSNLGGFVALGAIGDFFVDGFGNMGELGIDAVWTAATDAPAAGSFYRIEDDGIVCITTPCFSGRAYLLNAKRSWWLDDLDLGAAGATGDQYKQAKLAGLDGQLIVAGTLAGNGKKHRTLKGSQFYLPVEPVECLTDADCTLSVWTGSVSSVEDCYCPMCPVVMSAADAAENEADYQTYCSDWASGPSICPIPMCIQPPPIGSVKNSCAYLPDETFVQ